MAVTWNDDRFVEKRCGLFILRVTPPFRQHVANYLPSHSSVPETVNSNAVMIVLVMLIPCEVMMAYFLSHASLTPTEDIYKTRM